MHINYYYCDCNEALLKCKTLHKGSLLSCSLPLYALLPTVYSTDLLARAGAPGQSPLSTPSDQ